MGGGFASRFALEAGFLVLLAVGVGLADLRPLFIIGVMVLAWVLVTLIEWLAWHAERRQARAVAELIAPPVAPEPQPGWSVEDILVPEEELVDYPPPPKQESEEAAEGR